MKENFKTWFAHLPTVPGMLACGVRRPNGKCAGLGDETKYPAEKIEKLLNQFAEEHKLLAGFSPRWTTWAFEYSRLRFVLRPDKCLLLLLVAPETEAENSLDQLSREFLTIAVK